VREQGAQQRETRGPEAGISGLQVRHRRRHLRGHRPTDPVLRWLGRPAVTDADAAAAVGAPAVAGADAPAVGVAFAPAVAGADTPAVGVAVAAAVGVADTPAVGVAVAAPVAGAGAPTIAAAS